MTPEPWASVIWASKVNIACSGLNMITTAVLIYGTLMLRKANRLNAETRRLLDEREKRIRQSERTGA
jgi:uncharacterized membrane protein